MKKQILSGLAALLVAACATESDNGGLVREGLLTVGSCELSDTIAQRQWAERLDWDLAICDGMIRTNGGDSGCGQGGIAVSEQDFDTTDATQPASLMTDRDSVEVW